jgi:riboflavin synthase
MTKVGVVDTTFASVDMGGVVVRTLQANATGLRIERYTVPGIKDLAVACKRLFDAGCEIVVACGMPGPEAVDKQSAHVASMGLQWAQIGAGRHIVEVFVHLDEAKSPKELEALCANRASEHALNAIALLKGPTALTPRAGTGQRQGYADVGGAEALRPGVNPFEARHAASKGPGVGARSETGSKFSGSNAGKH